MTTISRDFGIEIELKGISMETSLQALLDAGLSAAMEGYNHCTRAHWKLVIDGSVRGGHEVVSPILHGEAGLAEAMNAARALENAGARIDKQCGLHVHFNARDMSVEEIRTIATRYATFEDKIDTYMPKSRRGDANTYCRSVVELFLHSRRVAEASTINELIEAQGGRYFKLNLQSYHRHHTIEFRQHAGSVDAQKIGNWVRFLSGFIDESLRIAHSEHAGLPSLQTAQRKLVDLLEDHSEGISAEALQNHFGLLPHSLRAAISYLRKTGVAIETSRRNGETVYRLGNGRAADSLFAGIDNSIRDFYENRATALAA